MRFIIVGAGAVGVTLGLSLEHQKHDVTYLVRPGRKAALNRFLLVDARSGTSRKRDRPSVAELGNTLQPFEWVILATRGDQLDEAIATLKAHAKPTATVVLAAAALDALPTLRAAWTGPVVQMYPTFSAWSEEPNVWRWFQPPLLKSLLSGEGDDKAQKAAVELAAELDKAGLPSRAVASLQKTVAPLLAPGVALLAGWELAAWDVERLGKDGLLRDLTAGAMHEAAVAVGAEAEGVSRFLSFIPAGALSIALRALPRLAGKDVRAMWSHHGPKIAAQTRAILDEVMQKAEHTGDRHLKALRAKLT